MASGPHKRADMYRHDDYSQQTASRYVAPPSDGGIYVEEAVTPYGERPWGGDACTRDLSLRIDRCPAGTSRAAAAHEPPRQGMYRGDMSAGCVHPRNRGLSVYDRGTWSAANGVPPHSTNPSPYGNLPGWGSRSGPFAPPVIAEGFASSPYGYPTQAVGYRGLRTSRESPYAPGEVNPVLWSGPGATVPLFQWGGSIDPRPDYPGHPGPDGLPPYHYNPVVPQRCSPPGSNLLSAPGPSKGAAATGAQQKEGACSRCGNAAGVSSRGTAGFGGLSQSSVMMIVLTFVLLVVLACVLSTPEEPPYMMYPAQSVHSTSTLPAVRAAR